jgi:hypothetical protein
MKPQPKRCKVDQILNTLFDTDNEESCSSDTKSNTDDSDSDSFQDSAVLKSFTKSSVPTQTKQEKASNQPLKQIENIPVAKSNANHNQDGDNDYDDDDDIPLYKLIRHVNKKASHKENVLEVEKQQPTDDNADDDDDDDIPISKLLSMQKGDDTNKPSNKLTRVGESKSMEQHEHHNNSVSFLKGLYDFDEGFCKETVIYGESNFEDLDQFDVRDQSSYFVGLKSPIIQIAAANSFVLSIKNLKRKKSKLISRIDYF